MEAIVKLDQQAHELRAKLKLYPQIFDNSIATILTDHVANISGINQKIILGKSREQDVYDARCIIIQWLYLAGWNDSKVGRVLNRDRTTILYGRNRFAVIYETDAHFRMMWREVCDAMLKRMKLG